MLLAVVERHSDPIVTDDNLGGLVQLIRERDLDLLRVGIPRVRGHLRYGGNRALVHLDAQMVDDSPVEAQSQCLAAVGHRAPFFPLSKAVRTLRAWAAMKGGGSAFPTIKAMADLCCTAGNL